MNTDIHVAGLLKKPDSVPNGMVGFDHKLRGEATADRVDVHKDGVFVYVRKRDFVIRDVQKGWIGTNGDVPVVAALVERRAPSHIAGIYPPPKADRFYVISTHLTSGDKDDDRKQEMSQLKPIIEQLKAVPHDEGQVTNVILGMDANCNVEDESNGADPLVRILPIVTEPLPPTA